MALRLGGGFSEAVNLLGPYEKWMFDIGKAFDLPDLMLNDEVNLSCVAEFPDAVDLDGFASITKVIQANGGRYWVKLPTLYDSPGFRARFLPFVIAPVDPKAPNSQLLRQSSDEVQNFLVRFKTDQARPTVNPGRFRFNFPIAKDTIDRNPAAPLPGGVEVAVGPAPKVIMAIIDLGVPFAHMNFRDKATGKTRIDYCWAQSAAANAGGEVLFGREVRGPQIDAMISALHGDEDAIYGQAGVLSRPNGPPMPLGRAVSHGAHVLDLMAGNWPDASAAEARIIAVDLPASSVWETSGFGKDMFVLSALHYIFDRADRIKQAHGCGDLPLVINLSYGYSGGPHDGQGMIEAAMAELVAHRNTLAPTTLIMPSGNMMQDRLHAQLTDAHFTPDPQNSAFKLAELHWQAPPDDRTSSYLEFWYPPGTDLGDIRVQVTAPGQATAISTDDLAHTDPTFFGATFKVDNKAVGQLTVDHYRNRRWRVTVLLAPTDTFAPAERLTCGPDVYSTAPAGVWTLTFRVPATLALPAVIADAHGDPAPGGIACRIQRDTSYGQGETGAKQSFFLDPTYAPFAVDGAINVVDGPEDAHKLRRFGSLNGMATGAETVVVAGHRADHCKASVYSSAGAIVLSDLKAATVGKAVAVSAPTDRHAVLPGVVAAGTRSGTTVALQGTSCASPQVARELALSYIEQPGAGDALQRLAQRQRIQKVMDPGDTAFGQARLGGLQMMLADP